MRAEPDPRPPWLETADDLARSLLERATPVRFELAHTPEDLAAVFALRYRVSVEQGWLRPEDMPGGVERDEYDDQQAAQIAGWDRSTLAATARVVYPLAGRPLPTEAAFGITIEPIGGVVDAGRLIVAPDYRDGEHRVLGGLAAAIWRAMSARGFRWAAVAISDPMIDLCRTLGFDVGILGSSRRYWGEDRRAALLTAPDPGAWN